MKEIEGLWALNTKKGTILKNPDIGALPGGMAVPITERQRLIVKHLIGVVILDRVKIIEEEKNGSNERTSIS